MKKLLLDNIYKQLIEFRKLFNLYLQHFVIPLYDLRINKNDIINFYRLFSHHFTFNYTPTAEKIYNAESNHVQYLHGKSGLEKENIIFGINDIFDESGIIDNYLHFTKFFQKYNLKTDYYFLNKIHQTDINYHFVFWGHSLDQSDAFYINSVFDFLQEKQNVKKKITIIYHNHSSYSKLLENLFIIRGRKDIEERLGNQSLVLNTLESEEFRKSLNIFPNSSFLDPKFY